MRQGSALSFSLSNLASTVEPRGSGAAMSPFTHNPSPRLAADWAGPGRASPASSELPLRVRCQLQSQRVCLIRDKGEIFFFFSYMEAPGFSRWLSLLSSVNESGLTFLLVRVIRRLVNLTPLC